MKLKKKVVKKKEIKQEEPKIEEIKLFETTDKDLAYKLSAMGHTLKEVKSPFGGRGKLYIFKADENIIKQALI